MTAIPMKKGEYVTGPNGVEWVFAPCDSTLASFWCEDCRISLPHRQALKQHVATAGEHRIARWCDKHKVYEAPPPKTPTQGGNEE